MTDIPIPSDVLEAAREALVEAISASRSKHADAAFEVIARAILADRAAQAERMARMEEALRTVKSMRSIDAIAPAVHDFEREKRSEAWAKIDEIVARALSQEGRCDA